MKKMFLLIILLIIPDIGCITGNDTILITTDPSGADLYTITNRAPYDYMPIRNGNGVQKYVGKTPTTVPAPWGIAAIPLIGFRQIKITLKVTIKKNGYATLTDSIGHSVMRHNKQHLVGVHKGSKFGWGNTYEYHFKLQSLLEIEEARQEELLDIKEVAKLLRERGLRVSIITIYKWMEEGQLPKPVTPSRDDDGAVGARWRRGDIESWKPEIQESGD